jgi:hypothetical protein
MNDDRSRLVLAALAARAHGKGERKSWNELWKRRVTVTALEGEPMNDATKLDEQLRALLDEHGAADLLRAMSASARGLAETHPDDEDEWIDAAAAAAQAAEALVDGEDAAAVEDGEDDEESESGDEGEGEGGAPLEAITSNAPAPSVRRHEPTPPSPNEGAMKDYAILPRRKDVTHWRARRVSEDGKKNSPLVWGDDDAIVERGEWPIKELSAETLLARWGEGWYVLQWFGLREDGKMRPLGRGNPVHILARSDDPPASERTLGGAARVPAPPPAAAPAGPSASGELLALAAMRNQAGGRGGDMASMLQLLAFMDERQERARQVQQQEARLAAERYRADAEVQIERERLATKERIAMIEANAQVQTRGRGGAMDPEAFAEAIGRKLQEVMPAPADDEEDTAPTTLAPGPTDYVTTINALRETLAPFLAALATKLTTDPPAGSPLPNPYKPRGNN